MSVRWLQITDVHEHEVDERFRKQTYERIVEEVGKQQRPPDLVFLTGDMAHRGKDAEYLSLEASLIAPLRAALPPGCPIFTVPGNHDVDRDGAADPRGWFANKADAEIFQSVEETGAQFRRDKLVPRFSGYMAFERRVAVWGSSDWLASKAGSTFWSEGVNGTKVAVVGINTSWLCQDKDDFGKLTPGRYMLEDALKGAALTKPDLLIVLGHHPLSAIISTGDKPDRNRIRDMLIRHNALYLHGDQHTSDAERIGEGKNNFLSVQAPAAFQARDNMEWRNGLMWGEADFKTGWVMIEPKLCNEAKGEFKFHNDAGWEKDLFWTGDRTVFRLHLPGHAPEELAPPLPKTDILIPSGWIKIDKAELAKIRARETSAEMMANFFDGEIPSWQLALAHGVKPRSIAEKLATDLRSARAAANKPRVELLLAAGSEGKSTALIHVAAALVDDAQQRWTCLYRQAAHQPLPKNWLVQLPARADHAWLVVIDDADNIARDIFSAVEKIAGRGDIHLLLAARDAEWQIRKIPNSTWARFCTFMPGQLSGLSEIDARRIVDAWSAWGSQAMGATGASAETAVVDLLRHARDTAAKNEGGELLGALLLTRQGEHLKARVAHMIEGLRGKPVIGRKRRSLRDVYAMIAAMHAENQLYLSQAVLDFALECEAGELDEKALRVLRRETRLLEAGGTYVLSRHRVIAEAVCAVLREDNYDLDKVYPFLAWSARKLYLNTNRQAIQDDIAKWNFKLAEHFVEKGASSWAVARAVAEQLHRAEPTNPYLLTQYSKILRKTNQPDAAWNALKDGAQDIKRDRAFFYDWSTVAGNVDKHGVGVWLAGYSLADRKDPIDPRRCELSLAGLGIAFGVLHAASHNKIFAKAQAGCGQLGLLLPDISEQSQESLEKAVSDGRRNGFANLSLNDARKAIYDGVVAGSESDEVELGDAQYFENLIGDPRGYRYAALQRQIPDASRSR